MIDQVLSEVMTGLRVLVARELRRRGASQVRIARLLGISQPAVHRYLSEGAERAVAWLRELGVGDEELRLVSEAAATYLERGRVVDAHWLLTMQALRVMAEGRACGAHRARSPNVPEGCDLCRRLYEALSYEDPVVLSVRRAVEIFLRAPGAVELIPEVGANVAEVRPGGLHPMDVVAVPGRILRVLGAPKPGSEPRYGASRHLALVLVELHRRFPALRGAVVVRYDRRLVELAEAEMRVARLPPRAGYEPDPTASVVELVRRLAEPPDVLVDEGGYGVEPVVYFFGGTAVSAVSKCLELHARIASPARASGG